MTKYPESTTSFIMTPLDPLESLREPAKENFTDRVTFRISPHGDTKEAIESTTVNNQLDTSCTNGQISLAYPIIPTRDKSASTKSAVAEGGWSKNGTRECTLCSAMSPRPCPIHRANRVTPMGPNGELYHDFSKELLIAQEREYIRASHNHKLTLTQRVRLAHRASDVHNMRTGRRLNINSQDACIEDMFEECYSTDDLPSSAQAREPTLEMAEGRVRTILSKIHNTTTKAGASQSEAKPSRNASSSSESSGRMTPNSTDESSMELHKCSSILEGANRNRLPSFNETEQAAILALDLRNPHPNIYIPTRYSSGQGEEKVKSISSHLRSTIDQENTINGIVRLSFDCISINERFDALSTHLALLQSDGICSKQGSVLVTARSLSQQLNWLRDDLKEHLGEERMSKRPEMGVNLTCDGNRASSQRLGESTLQKQQKLEMEPVAPSVPVCSSLAQICEKLTDRKAGQKEEGENLVHSTLPKNELQSQEPISDRKQLEKLANGTNICEEQELKQHAADHRDRHHRPTTKQRWNNLENKVSIMTSNGANLAQNTADLMAKNAIDRQKVEGQRTFEELQKILDDEIALLRKKKIRQELERELAGNETEVAEVLHQKKHSEQCQKNWNHDCKGKELKTKPKIKVQIEEQFWDRWNGIHWNAALSFTAAVFAGVPVCCTIATLVWYIFSLVFYRDFWR